MSKAHIKRWLIGQVEVIRIVEIDAHEDEITTLLKDANRELLLSYGWLQPHFVTPEGKIRISFQCFLVRSQGLQIMVDTCIGNGRERAIPVFHQLQTDFLEDLEHVGAKPEEIDVVLCTHLHNDHVGWNTRWAGGRWAPTFPNARYLFAAEEVDHWQRERLTGEIPETDHFPDSIDPVLEAGLVDRVRTDHRITDEVRLFPTPGHTPGHVCIAISSDGHEAVITGDMMHHPLQIARPDIMASFDWDPGEAAQTRREFVEAHARNGALVIGTHFCDPTSGRIVPDAEGWKLEVQDR
jgi:glyoxylase-like metal-dependent hydrolase (beta-lactamase superfamily II)